MGLVNKLTEQEVTPGTLLTALSTRATQAAHDIPVTVYFSIKTSDLSVMPLINLIKNLTLEKY